MELTIDQIVLFLLIVGVFALLLWGRVRYDIVAFAALIITIITGVIPVEQAFAGFGHPATVIIALVLVVSRGLSNSGAVEFIARFVVSGSRTITMHIGLMSGVGAALSALMNNVAALALLMPVDGEAAKRADRSPALTLMPLSFATILGGMVTLIGTPPNIVVATFRNDALGEPFRMFDFAAVGGVVAIVGVVFVTLFGWRLLPVELVKRDARKELQDLAGYVSEAIVLQGSNIVGESLREVFPLAEDHDVAILGLVRNGRRLPGSARREKVSVGDFVVMEGAATAMETFIGTAGRDVIRGSASRDTFSGSGSQTTAASWRRSSTLGARRSIARCRNVVGVPSVGGSRAAFIAEEKDVARNWIFWVSYFGCQYRGRLFAGGAWCCSSFVRVVRSGTTGRTV